MDTSIIIPTYNQPELLRHCLRAVNGNTRLPYKLVISDDCSPDPAMQEYLRTLGTIVRRNEAQLGFPANVNRAVAETDSPYICLLNQDTRVCVGWLEALRKEMEDPDVGIVGGKLLYPREKGAPWGDTLQHAGVANDGQGPFHIWRGMPKDYPPANVRRELNAVTYACVLIRRTLWDQLGGLDEGYRGGQFEDVHQCWAARALGWKIVYTPECMVYHYEHGAGEEWVRKTEVPNLKRLLEQFPRQPVDTHLFDRVDSTLDGLAAFVHQIRAAAIMHTISYRHELGHPRRLAAMAFDELPGVEQEWARAHARRLKEVLQ